MNKLIAFSEKYQKNSIHTIKLKSLLEMRESSNQLRQITTMFPQIEVGSITLVDQITLLALIELINPKKILEIGTYQGYTTRLFLNNTFDSQVITIDLPIFNDHDKIEVDRQRILSDSDYNDYYLRHVQNNSGELYLKNLSEKDSVRLKLIKSDSEKLDFDSEVGSIDFAFIDGGHRYDIVSNDTRNVRASMKMGVIVWHDYSSAIHSDVTKYLSEYSKENQVFYVSGGLCAFQVVINDIRV